MMSTHAFFVREPVFFSVFYGFPLDSVTVVLAACPVVKPTAHVEAIRTRCARVRRCRLHGNLVNGADLTRHIHTCTINQSDF
jgi:hypothetical protein